MFAERGQKVVWTVEGEKGKLCILECRNDKSWCRVGG